MSRLHGGVAATAVLVAENVDGRDRQLATQAVVVVLAERLDVPQSEGVTGEAAVEVDGLALDL